MAQDAEDGTATQGDDAVYLSVTFVSFKPGMRGEAFGIIDDHFVPASIAAGTAQPVAVHFQTGPWDASFHWRLENGMADLEWFTSPRDVKWRAALVAQEGSEEAADALQASFTATIARSVTAVGHRHVAEED